MRGQKVVCKGFDGDALELVVWEDSSSLIYVHSEDQFEARMNGRPHLESVGFPVEDVFIWKERLNKTEVDWSKLQRYCPVTASSLQQI